MTDKLTCGRCDEAITTTEYLNCYKCNLNYDLNCTNVSEKRYRLMSQENKNTWTCAACLSKIADAKNISTPIPSISTPVYPTGMLNTKLQEHKTESLSDVDKDPFVNKNRRTTKAIPFYIEDDASMTEIMEKFKQLACHIENKLEHFGSILNEKMSSVTLAIEKCHGRLDNLTENVNLIENRISKLEQTASNQNPATDSKMKCLDEVIDALEQEITNNEIEIAGIPEHGEENLTHIIKVASTKIGRSLEDHEIDYVKRVGPKRRNDQSPRIVVARFTRRPVKSEILHAARVRKGLSSKDIEVEGKETTIYWNERLTKKRRQLFHECRLQAKEGGYSYCWTKNGHILLRQKDKSEIKYIRNQEDLQKLFPNVIPTKIGD